MSKLTRTALRRLPRGPLEPERISYADLVSTIAESAEEPGQLPELTTLQLAAVLRAHPQILSRITDADLAADILEDLTEHAAFYHAAPLVGAAVLGRLEYHAQRRLLEDVRAKHLMNATEAFAPALS